MTCTNVLVIGMLTDTLQRQEMIIQWAFYYSFATF